MHRESPPAREVRALLVGRERPRGKLPDLGPSIRGILRGLGLELGEAGESRFAARGSASRPGASRCRSGSSSRCRARDAPRAEHHVPHGAALAIVREDAVHRRLMTVPGVGALVAVTFTSAVDDPTRFRRSRAVGARFGPTPERYRSGETDVTGGIGEAGDAMVRTALYEAANVMPTGSGKFSTLERRAPEVALAREPATVSHRLWVKGGGFRRGREAAAA